MTDAKTKKWKNVTGDSTFEQKSLIFLFHLINIISEMFFSKK